jgi:hypothetical protein
MCHLFFRFANIRNAPEDGRETFLFIETHNSTVNPEFIWTYQKASEIYIFYF